MTLSWLLEGICYQSLQEYERGDKMFNGKKGIAFIGIIIIGIILTLLVSIGVLFFITKSIFLIIGAMIVLIALFMSKGKFNMTTIILVIIGVLVMFLPRVLDMLG